MQSRNQLEVAYKLDSRLSIRAASPRLPGALGRYNCLGDTHAVATAPGISPLTSVYNHVDIQSRDTKKIYRHQADTKAVNDKIRTVTDLLLRSRTAKCTGKLQQGLCVVNPKIGYKNVWHGIPKN